MKDAAVYHVNPDSVSEYTDLAAMPSCVTVICLNFNNTRNKIDRLQLLLMSLMTCIFQSLCLLNSTKFCSLF